LGRLREGKKEGQLPSEEKHGEKSRSLTLSEKGEDPPRNNSRSRGKGEKKGQRYK